MNWQNKNVLVAGGAGMIGSHMAKEMVKRGAKVTIADNLSSGSRKNINSIYKDVKFMETDLTQYRNCEKATQGQDIVFQFAADMGGIGYITAIAAQIMFNNTAINTNMLTAARLFKTPLFFFSSTACIYPNFKQTTTDNNSINLKEEDAIPADPNEFYGWEKLYCEKLVEACQKDYGMNIRVARFHNIYGSVYTAFDKQKGKAPCHLIMKAIKHPNPEMTIWGDGKAVRSFLYIDDCIKGVIKLMESEYCKPINIGSDRAISVDELAKIIIKISGKKIELKHELDKPQGVRGRNADLTLVKQVLNWQPKVSLEDGLASVYQWANDNFNKLEGV